MSLVFADESENLVDLDFHNAPVSAVLQSIAVISEKNVVVASDVSNLMSLHLKKMSIPTALRLVLESQNLKLRVMGNTWFIGKMEDFLAQSKVVLEALNQQELEEPLATDFLSIHYANVKALQALLLDDKALIGSRGHLAIDSRTNTLIVTDTAMHLKNIRRVVEHLDVSLVQVHVDAKIVEVDQSALEAFGILLSAASQASGAVLSSASVAMNLPIDNPTGSLSLGLKHFMKGELDFQLQALEKSGKGKVISAPALTVLDNQEASIEQGNEVPYQTSTASGATQIEFKKAVLGLKVIPHVTEQREINLLLQVNKDSISQNIGPSGNIPIVNTAQVITNVLVESGETIILGGIYSEEQHEASTGIPILGSIPGFGWLFHNKNDSKRSADLLIFVTPTIVEGEGHDAMLSTIKSFEGQKGKSLS